MVRTRATGSVVLAEASASETFRAVLAEAIAAYPETFRAVQLPEHAKAFKKRYPELLPRYEAARAASPERNTIARHLADALGHQIVWEDERGRRPLAEALAEPATPLPLETCAGTAENGWQPSVDYGDACWSGTEIGELGRQLAARDKISPAAGLALEWVADTLLADGMLRLAGRKIVMIGASAEMAPTRQWVEAGADVLWLDTVPPPRDWLDARPFSGRVTWAPDGADLLARPREALATILAFADGQPIDLGLYAYAPGQSRELRLTGAMNALVEALPPELVASVTTLVSPTTATALNEHDCRAMDARRERRPKWESALAKFGLLGRGGGRAEVEGSAATRTVVGIQGASYQAAQYLGKVIAAERWATYGTPASSEPLRVSANTAAITRTRSMSHPVFAAAFVGATAFGVESFRPGQSQVVSGLLAVHDWLRPERPEPGRVRVHGGLHVLPYPLAPSLQTAAAVGFAGKPRLLGGLLKR